MKAEVEKALDKVLHGAAQLRNAKGAGRIFELFILTGIGVRLQSLGCTVQLQRSDETVIAPTDVDRKFIQRGGAPTGVPPRSAGPGNASTILFSKPGSAVQWEIWNGVQFEGRSGALHEIDIAVVPRDMAVELRKTGGKPFGRPHAALECKDVGTNGSLDETRAFVARLYDLSILKSHEPYIGQPPPALSIYPQLHGTPPVHFAKQTYREGNKATFNAIARRSGFSAGTARMMGYYAVRAHSNIKAGTTEATQLIEVMTKWLMAELA